MMGLASADVRAMVLNLPFPSKTAVYSGHMPTDETTPCDCLAIYDMGGGEQSAKFAEDNLNLHFLSRTVKYPDGWANLNLIKELLEGAKPIIIRTQPDKMPEVWTNPPHSVDSDQIKQYTKYIGFWVSSPPAFVPRDENNRPLFSMHMRIAREPLGAGSGNRTTIGSKYPITT